MKLLFYAAKVYDKKSFDPILENYKEIEIDYIDHELEPRTAALAKGYDAVCAFVSADVGAKTLEVLKENGVGIVLMRCAGFNNVDPDIHLNLLQSMQWLWHLQLTGDFIKHIIRFVRMIIRLKVFVVSTSFKRQQVLSVPVR